MSTKDQEVTQTSAPPAWAAPLLKKVAGTAMDLYDRGEGYNTYRGPTQAPLSDVTLGGMNSLLAATGYQGAPVSNESINALIPEVDMQPQKRQQQPSNPMGLTRVNTQAGNLMEKFGATNSPAYQQFGQQWAIQTPDGQTIPLPNQVNKRGGGGLW